MGVKAFLKGTLHDKGTPSYSRIFALPFLGGSFVLGVIDGVVSLVNKNSALDAVASLAIIGIALFTGSKALSIKGMTFNAGPDAPAPVTTTTTTTATSLPKAALPAQLDEIEG